MGRFVVAGWIIICLQSPFSLASLVMMPAGIKRSRLLSAEGHTTPVDLVSFANVEAMQAFKKLVSSESSSPPAIKLPAIPLEVEPLMDDAEHHVREVRLLKRDYVAHRLVGDRMASEAAPMQGEFNMRRRPPMIHYSWEVVILADGSEITVMKNAIVRRIVRRTSVLYETRDGMYLKYELNCDAVKSGAMHPLVREYVVQREIADLNISMEILYLSNAMKFELPLTPKTDVSLSPEKLVECAKHPLSSVRLLVMKKGGQTLDEIAVKNRFGIPVKRALDYTIQLLKLIESLHSRDIVHGDIHPGNVVTVSDGTLRLIDFGKSFFSSDFEGHKEIIYKPLSFVHCLLSPYNLQGSRFGFRDDLYKALHVLAVLMMGDSFSEYCSRLATSSDPQALLKFKNEGFYFTRPRACPIESIPDIDQTTKLAIKHHLGEAMQIARSQFFVDRPVPIADVVSHLEEARGRFVVSTANTKS